MLAPMRDAIAASLRDDLTPRLREVALGTGGRAAFRATVAARLRRRPWFARV